MATSVDLRKLRLELSPCYSDSRLSAVEYKLALVGRRITVSLGNLRPTSLLSPPRRPNQHLQPAVQRDLLVSLEGRSS
jgi:hypothetical protein